MTYRNLLVHLDDRKASAKRLEAAIALAQDQEAHLTGLYLGWPFSFQGYYEAQIPREVLEQRRADEQKGVAAAKARFESATGKAGLAAEWRYEDANAGDPLEILSLHARYADLIVLGQREPETAGSVANLTEEVIMTCGRPALVVPYVGAGKTLGTRPLIAWDGGREAARAVSDALPLLTKAKQTTLVTVTRRAGKGAHGEQPGADIAVYLARHGVKVEVQNLTRGNLTVADMILSRISDLSSDLLVMGCYAHSRLRELILGGVTRQMMAEMTVPVLMAH